MQESTVITISVLHSGVSIFQYDRQISQLQLSLKLTQQEKASSLVKKNNDGSSEAATSESTKFSDCNHTDKGDLSSGIHHAESETRHCISKYLEVPKPQPTFLSMNMEGSRTTLVTVVSDCSLTDVDIDTKRLTNKMSNTSVDLSAAEVLANEGHAKQCKMVFVLPD